MKKDQLAKVFIAAGEAVKYISKAKNKKSVFQTVKAFQKLDGTLKADGQWGNNTHAAAAWYLQRDDIPDSAFPNGTITWQPPDLSENAKDPEIAEKVSEAKASGKSTSAKKSILASKSKKPLPKASRSPFVATRTTPKAVQHALVHDAPSYGQAPEAMGNNGDTRDVEASISKYLTNNVNPRINDIYSILQKQNISKAATQEHRKIVDNTDNRKQVIDLLKQILAKVNSQKVALDRRTLATIVI